ncbi:SDR family NAD(P)-dependent oxidoreductase [Paenibacillus alkaliterrae]
MLLAEGHHVCGLFRSSSDLEALYSNYHHATFDLSQIFEIELIVKSIIGTIPYDQFEMICLVNNAAMLELLKPIDRCTMVEIFKEN